jgi:hypothetical protein
MAVLDEQMITRKQFLQYCGAIIVSVFGFNTIISLLTGKARLRDGMLEHGDNRHGFGSRKFGQ